MNDNTVKHVKRTIVADFDRAGCTAAWNVVDMNSGAEIGVRSYALVVMTYVFKMPVAMEFYAQAAAGNRVLLHNMRG